MLKKWSFLRREREGAGWVVFNFVKEYYFRYVLRESNIFRGYYKIKSSDSKNPKEKLIFSEVQNK